MIDRGESAEPADVLLVEPSDERARHTRDGFSDTGATTMHAVSDGDEALAFLEGRDEYADAPAPCLVVLRLELPGPGPDGVDVLERMAERTELSRIPVVVTVDEPEDDVVTDAYNRGANAVLPTPSDPAALAETMARVAEFWIATARLPNRIDRL
ncbi:response regulator [Haloterrigena sp. SYSU A558-1]|uniref:Response regulator n=1 Tax=Haloterrigena gelatinilytica TaxID=2741724 RepID=A0A8J8KGC5_9EURY|nr:response regulator [Haloterrigena gelatinilytica]NUB92411.1 response regulator [Haloterrigena gelatinilytica]NUC71763.1 response regulator [Haloterrigena gelatinilytica]